MNLKDILGGLRKSNESKAFGRVASTSSTGGSMWDGLPEMVLRTGSFAAIAGIDPD